MKKPKEFSCLSGSLRKSRWILDESIFFLSIGNSSGFPERLVMDTINLWSPSGALGYLFLSGITDHHCPLGISANLCLLVIPKEFPTNFSDRQFHRLFFRKVSTIPRDVPSYSWRFFPNAHCRQIIDDFSVDNRLISCSDNI